MSGACTCAGLDRSGGPPRPAPRSGIDSFGLHLTSRRAPSTGRRARAGSKSRTSGGGAGRSPSRPP
eukprot:14092017-Alexandrium_andersonii.AAC.1